MVVEIYFQEINFFGKEGCGPACRPGGKAREETQDHRQAGHDRQTQELVVGRRNREGFEDPVGADGKMADAPCPAAQQCASRPRRRLPEPDEDDHAHDGQRQPIERRHRQGRQCAGQKSRAGGAPSPKVHCKSAAIRRPTETTSVAERAGGGYAADRHRALRTRHRTDGEPLRRARECDRAGRRSGRPRCRSRAARRPTARGRSPVRGVRWACGH